MPSTDLHSKKYYTDDFNVRASVLIYTKLYTCETRMYYIKHFSGAFLNARIGRLLIVC